LGVLYEKGFLTAADKVRKKGGEAHFCLKKTSPPKKKAFFLVFTPEGETKAGFLLRGFTRRIYKNQAGVADG